MVWILTANEMPRIGEGFCGFDIELETEAAARKHAHECSMKEFGHDNQGWLDPTKTTCRTLDQLPKVETFNVVVK
jgi:hypothetical protein